MKLKDNVAFTDAKSNYIDLVKNGASEEEQGQAYESMIDSLYETVKQEASKDAANAVLEIKDTKLNKEEYEFFNEINTEVGYKDETLLPATTIDKIFEDLTVNHPLLSALNIVNAGPRVTFLRSDTSGAVVWGRIFDEIRGQLDAIFTGEEELQNKVTAFVVVPKDLQDLGAQWVEQFVRLQITEAFATGLELAFLTGDGNDKPVGLNKDLESGTVANGVTTYSDKAPSGTIALDPVAQDKSNMVELSKIKTFHSTKQSGNRLNTSGRLNLVVNPEDMVNFEIAFTSLNLSGVYVKSTPFNINLIESEAQPVGQATSFVSGRYDAAIGGGLTIRKYDQTLAMEDMDLYTAKQFAFGQAADNKASAVWTLAGTSAEPETV